MVRLGFMIAAACLSVSSPAWSGEVTRQAGQDFEWSSTECVRPARPFIRQDNPQKDALVRDYGLKIAYYLDCLKREAQRDFDRSQMEMQDAIQRRLQKETDHLNDDVLQLARGR